MEQRRMLFMSWQMKMVICFMSSLISKQISVLECCDIIQRQDDQKMVICFMRSLIWKQIFVLACGDTYGASDWCSFRFGEIIRKQDDQEVFCILSKLS
ncbi:hypothetical protein O6H91_15G040000 [Diphasiastrum complanatum]|uniref:Uncharacterized protein n=1 Tax=Diphasiastrum complanatum TaxID=34168 RepID=A0ACC2BHN2_DIPCM|nr:hypothetical protein O6H91_15G040000 [Diphasiastrum complanatum]